MAAAWQAGLVGGPAWAWIGMLPLVTSPAGFCPTYRLLGVSTCGTNK
jgi:hypothetical protein